MYELKKPYILDFSKKPFLQIKECRTNTEYLGIIHGNQETIFVYEKLDESNELKFVGHEYLENIVGPNYNFEELWNRKH